LKPGDDLFLFDGKGSEYRARITASTPKAVVLSVTEELPSISESPAKITIGQGLLKAKKMDSVVRQVTELGIHALIPVIAERSVPKPKTDRWAEKRQRWKTIAWESLKQCGRSQTPRIAAPTSFEALVHASDTFAHKIIFHDADPESAFALRQDEAQEVSNVVALIGPEGGFSPHEIQMAINSGFRCASLGPRILKADTAVVAACTILQYLFGDLKNP
jgi:16S rRNA (uracil1498-N3)-methyltransferase